MGRRLTAALLLAALALALPATTSSAPIPPTPRGFFGIAPQTPLTDTDAAYMRAGGIETVRWPLDWSAIQPTAGGGYHWGGFDEVLTAATRAGLRVLPVLYGNPAWISSKRTTLPVANARRRAAWTAFLRAAVGRYGPGGEFWVERSPKKVPAEPVPVPYEPAVNYEPAVVESKPAIPKPLPIREWQIWNEANFFYFTFPVSPRRYAKLLTISSRAIKGTDPGAKVILAGLFGKPTAKGARGMPAAKFLSALYRVPGIKSRFDGVALHPYAVDAETLAEFAEELRTVILDNRDRSAGLYITEMGWGSQNNFEQVAFEQGVRGQVRQLRDSYSYLIANRRRLNLKQVHWFSWKDIDGACNFCDSVGLFRRGARLKPKPAWHALVRVAGGRPRP